MLSLRMYISKFYDQIHFFHNSYNVSVKKKKTNIVHNKNFISFPLQL